MLSGLNQKHGCVVNEFSKGSCLDASEKGKTSSDFPSAARKLAQTTITRWISNQLSALMPDPSQETHILLFPGKLSGACRVEPAQEMG